MSAPKRGHSHWDAEAVVQKWFAKNLFQPQTTTPTETIHFYNEDDHIPIHELESALVKSAKIVEQLGKDYLPIFERIESELEQAKRDLDTMERVRNIASSMNRSDLNRYLVKP